MTFLELAFYTAALVVAAYVIAWHVGPVIDAVFNFLFGPSNNKNRDDNE